MKRGQKPIGVHAVVAAAGTTILATRGSLASRAGSTYPIAQRAGKAAAHFIIASKIVVLCMIREYLCPQSASCAIRKLLLRPWRPMRLENKTLYTLRAADNPAK